MELSEMGMMEFDGVLMEFPANSINSITLF